MNQPISFVAAGFLLAASALSHAYAAEIDIVGEKYQWHKTTLLLTGPSTSATATDNPFLNYRFNVTFTSPTGKAYTVPGYFAGDGNGGGVGDKWVANLNPHEVGKWTYKVSFRSGPNAAVSLSDTEGTAMPGYDGEVGEFSIAASTKSGDDFRVPNKGMLINRGHHYLTFTNGQPFIYAGPGIPENLLGYRGFTNTTVGIGRTFANHIDDWKPGDPDWDNGKGKAMIGMFNYIAEQGANCVYFISNSLIDDGKDTFPHLQPTFAKSSSEPSDPHEWDKLLRYDLLKLKQWDVALSHAQSKGIFLNWHFAEHNNLFLYGGSPTKSVMTPHRKLYFRMMIAHFGHYNGVLWNLGEECKWKQDQFIEQIAYLKAINPYDAPVTFQTGGAGQKTDTCLAHLGNTNLDVLTFQAGWNYAEIFKQVQGWKKSSSESSVPLCITLEEPQKIENNDTDETGYPYGRREKMWPWMMSGGDAFQWYVQQSKNALSDKVRPHSFDHSIDDMRTMKNAFNWSGHMRQFLSLLPLLTTTSSMELVQSHDGGRVSTLYRDGDIYAVYNNKVGKGMTLDLTGKTGEFTVKWFDPRNGGALQDGEIKTITGGDKRALGRAPKDENSDWAVLITKLNYDPLANIAPIVSAGSQQTIYRKNKATLNGFASDDFLPKGSTVTVNWSLVSGPKNGAVTFDNPRSSVTQASFSEVGKYTLRLTASDSDKEKNSEVSIEVIADPNGNTAPVISLAPKVFSNWVSATHTESLTASVSDDQLPTASPLTLEWSVIEPNQTDPTKPRAAFTSPNQATSGITFSAPGLYKLRLKATDGDLASVADVVFDCSTGQPKRPTLDSTRKTISGSGIVGGTVTIYFDSKPHHTLLITNADGTWSHELTEVPSGVHEITYTLTVNGSTSTRSDGAM